MKKLAINCLLIGWGLLSGCSSGGGYNGSFAYGKRDSNGVKIAYSVYNKGSTVAAEAQAHCEKYKKAARLKECGTLLLVCEYECVEDPSLVSPTEAK